MTTARRSKLRSAVVLAVVTLAAAVGLVVGGGGAGADVTSVSGDAFGAQVLLGGTPLVAATPVVTLPAAGGGPIREAPINVSLPGVLSVTALEVCTEGALTGDTPPATSCPTAFTPTPQTDGFAETFAQAAGVTVGGVPPLVPPALSADLIRSECRSDSSGSVGATTLVGINIPGIPTSPPANFVPATLPAGLVSIVANEQIPFPDPHTPGTTDIEVNALHVTLLSGPLPGAALLDVIIGHSHCDAAGPNVNTTTVPTTNPSSTSPSTSTPSTTTPSTTTPSTTTPSSSTTSTTTVGPTTSTTRTTLPPITVTPLTQPPAITQAPTIVTAATVVPTGLVRTGAEVRPMVLLAGLALLLGWLFILGTRGDFDEVLAGRFTPRRRSFGLRPTASRVGRTVTRVRHKRRGML